MEDLTSVLYASINKWPSKTEMIRILKSAGLNVSVGKYSITVNGCSYFKFQEYGGDLGDPCITADADNVEEMIRDAYLVSNALAKGGVFHSFEIYDHNEKMVKILKYDHDS